MEQTQEQKYLELMKVVRNRIDSIENLSSTDFDDFNKTEIAAFHGRKIIEAIAFGCLIAIKNGLKTIPKEAKGQYNAEKILKTLTREGITIFPSPSEIRRATPEEMKENNVTIVFEGIPDRRITKEELIKKYQRLHNWLHELNPYTKEGHLAFHQKNQEQLVTDLNELKLFLASHVISINGKAFFCKLKDKIDGKTKVISLTKIEDLID